MADEVKTKTTKPKAEKVVEEVKEIVEDVKPVEVAEVVDDPAPVVEAPVVEAEVADDDSEVEAMGRRGRRSKAEIAEQIKRTREDIESNYANLIDHEPAKADLFREELRNALKQLGL